MLNINEKVVFGTGEEKEVCPVYVLTAVQVDIVACTTPDGPSDDFSYAIILDSFIGAQRYVFNQTILGRIEHYEDEECYETYYVNGKNRAERLIEKMKEKGTIDLKYWTPYNDQPLSRYAV